MFRARMILQVCLILPLAGGIFAQHEAVASDTSGGLPAAVKSALDRRFPGWRLVDGSKDVRRFLKERVSADARPDLIRGDFDGNGQPDYALLLSHGGEFNNRGETVGPKVRLVVFLRKGGKYKFYELSDPGEYLTLGRKGEDGFDFHAGRKIKYRNDAIEVWIFEKAGWAYIYNNGRFRYVYSLD